MAVAEVDPKAAERVREDDRDYVLHSWSVQSKINPLPIAGAEGRYFWDYDGKRYLDFASQLVNVSIGHGHPKVIAAIKEQAEKLCTIGPPMATEPRSTLARMLAEVTPGRPARELDGVLVRLGAAVREERPAEVARRDLREQPRELRALVVRHRRADGA